MRTTAFALFERRRRLQWLAILVGLVALLPVAAAAILAPPGSGARSDGPAHPTAFSVDAEPSGRAAAVPPPEGGAGRSASTLVPPLTWTNLTGTSKASPGRLDQPSMAYDPATGNDLLFGGSTPDYDYGSRATNGTWSYANGAWTALHPSRTPPSEAAATMAFDGATGDFLLVSTDFYGHDANPPATSWEFANGNWTELLPSVVGGPPGTVDGAMAYDPDAGALIRFGGSQTNAAASTEQYSNATWEFGYGTWFNLTGPRGPPGLVAPAMAYAPAEHGIVMFGGVTASSGSAGTNQTWLWSNWTWTKLSLPWSPPGLTGAQMAWDPAVGGLALVGGSDEFGWNGPNGINLASYAFVNGSWTNLTPVAEFPGAVGAGIGYEPSSGGLLVYGGSATTEFGNTTWMLGRDPAVTITLNRTVTDARVPLGMDTGVGSIPPGEQLAWSFGDGGGASGPEATHPFAAPGTYAINLTGTLNVTGTPMYGFAQTEVTVLPDPADSVALGNNFVDVNDYATATASPSLGAGPYHVAWSFGDGSTQVGGWTVHHRYLTTGDFSLTATVTDHLGGTGATTVLVHVQPYPRVNLVTTKAAYDLGQSIRLFAATVNGSAPFTFTYAGLPPGCVSANVSNYTCQPTGTGSYAVQVTVLDANGLHVTSGLVTLAIAPPLNGTVGLSARVIDLGTNVTVAASLASDGSGGASVDLASSLPCVVISPFEQICTPVAPGTYAIFGNATDLSGATVPLVPTSLIVNPALTLNASAPRSPVERGTPVVLSVAAAGGTPPLRVDFESVPRGCYSLNATAFRCDLELAGTYDLTASVTDALGATAAAHTEVVVVAPSSGVGATPSPAPPASGSVDLVFWGLVAAAIAEIALSARQNRSPERRWRDRVRKGLWSVFGSAPIDASDSDAIPGADAPP